MLKKAILILGLFFGVLGLPEFVQASDKVPVYVFWGNGCPHCAEEKKFLEALDVSEWGIEVRMYEVYSNRSNAELIGKVGQELGIERGGVPLTVVGDDYLVGYSSVGFEKSLREMVDECKNVECVDVVEKVAGRVNGERMSVMGSRVVGPNREFDQKDTATKAGETQVKIPVFGVVDVAEWSLLGLSIVLGVVDGFNPCAMWVLIFLIGLLIGMDDVRRRWILGLAFIGTSGLIYFLFMGAWLQFFLFVGFLVWVRVAISLVALGSGVYQLKKFWEHKVACEVVPAEKRNRVFGRLKKVAQSQSLVWALVGIVAMAVSVNMVELLCSAGLPAVFTKVLSMSQLPYWQYLGYMLLYILFFMIDDLLVFVGAMMTLKVVGASHKYVYWSNLIGGVVMVVIGVLMLLKPGWLMMG